MMQNFNSYKNGKAATKIQPPRAQVNREDLFARIMAIETRIGEMA